MPDEVRQNVSVGASAGPVVGSVCTGYLGLDLGVLATLGGGRIAWCADPDPHIAQLLAARLPGVPNLGDVRAIDWTAVEPVEVLTAGFPCQDISAAGRRAGIENGARSGLWTDIVAGVRLLRPALLVVENVAALRWKGGGLHRVLGDLAEAGYDALWRSVRAADIGAAHRRERVFLCAWPRAGAADGGGGDAADSDRARRFLQRHLGDQPTRRSVAAGPVAAAADTDRLGREELHAQDAARWAIAARPGAAAADADGIRHRHGGASGECGFPAAAVAADASAGGIRGVPADAAGDRRDEGLSGAARVEGRPDAAVGGNSPDHPGQAQPVGVAAPPDWDTMTVQDAVRWGIYTAAVRRWEQVLGRAAPQPTQPGRHGRPVLAPSFVEWLQGLEPGWVTDLPLPRTAQLRALGNGVVPQQATYAVELLLADLTALLRATDIGTSVERLSDGQEASAA
ncbi:C-5 cytosine-specific DNA methylase [Kibdelosporangium phytohabitans]|uniref:DNA (cytosine-5-)-methyltransferase n=1 Tax=Kibdelosporangium phytohabitans TaxID=860235 RepID=A0A0N9IDW3_9PSEU|nr:C-5 cytosine-specific DNA methylase [Kibdelosporangium phytohabitans]